MIAELILKGFIPFSYSGISEVKYTPEQIMQIIIGTNGSGKSSLLRALSLAPMDAKEFVRGGYRELTTKPHNGHIYKMVSDYSSKTPKHEFWRDDTNLNQGGTGTVQKELVESHFGYTAFHHRLLTGKLKFTEMSPAARKDLLIMISGLELDYALGLYDKIRAEHRDTIGATKHVVMKYSELAKRLSAIENITGLKETARLIEEDLTKLMPQVNFAADSRGMKANLSGVLEMINCGTKKHKELMTKLRREYRMGKLRTGERIASVDDADTIYQKWLHRLPQIEQESSKLKEEMSSIHEQATRLQDLPADANEERLMTDIAALTGKRATLRACPEEYVGLSPDALIKQAHDAHSGLLAHIESIPADAEAFGVDDRQNNLTLLQQQQDLIARKRNELDGLRMKLNHGTAAAEGNVTCPKCDEVILATGAITPQRAEHLRGEIKTAESELNTLQVTMDELKKKQEKIESFVSLQKNILRLCKEASPLLMPTWKSCGNPSALALNPKEALSKFHGLISDFGDLKILEEVDRQLQEKNTLLDLVRMAGKGAVLNKYKDLEEKLISLQDEEKKAKNAERYYKYISNLLKEIFSVSKETEELVERADRQFEELIKTQKDEMVSAKVREQQGRLAEVNKVIQEYTNLNERLEELKQDEEKLLHRKKLLTILMNGLSPKQGIIAEQLHGVIRGVAKGINDIIDEVWEKELYLTVPEFGKNLDFIFPVSIEGIVGPDIKDLSSGQQEIVNLAMTIITMRQLELTDFPLLLDETGKAMDQMHRRNLMNYIKELASGDEFKSIFLISHYAAEYGAFSNAEIVVLNPDNIGIPHGDYNTNIVLA
jgi:DNA repair exonuclease SbcCD ATPase subunit